jgi:hypothetical protein
MVDDENKNVQVGAWIFEESSKNPNNDHGGDFDAKTATGSAVTLSNSRSYYERESVKVSESESPWSSARTKMQKSDFRNLGKNRPVFECLCPFSQVSASASSSIDSIELSTCFCKYRSTVYLFL